MEGIPLVLANTALFVALGVVVAALLIPAIWVISVYNGLRRSQVRAKNAFSQIDVQLKRRFELIPNLVETVKGYMQHERSTLEAVIAARAQAAGALGAAQGAMLGVSAITNLANASTALDGALGRLMGLVEAYPELKANQNALQLQEELASTENRIAFARQAYNDSVMRLNEQIVVFPASIVARTFGIGEMGLFEADAAARAAVAVKF
ncbi:MAG: LemA family protein [Planctomycetaceae bacterium]|nr:LemA family protein [Planctomycetaceae bacterium]